MELWIVSYNTPDNICGVYTSYLKAVDACDPQDLGRYFITYIEKTDKSLEMIKDRDITLRKSLTLDTVYNPED